MSRPWIEDEFLVATSTGDRLRLYTWSDGVVSWKKKRADLADEPDTRALVCICGPGADSPGAIHMVGCGIHGAAVRREMS